MNHLLWGDRIWMQRFANTEKPNKKSIPESIDETDGWTSYQTERLAMDTSISNWAESLDPMWLAGGLTWFSGAVNRERQQA